MKRNRNRFFREVRGSRSGQNGSHFAGDLERTKRNLKQIQMFKSAMLKNSRSRWGRVVSDFGH